MSQQERVQVHCRLRPILLSNQAHPPDVQIQEKDRINNIKEDKNNLNKGTTFVTTDSYHSDDIESCIQLTNDNKEKGMVILKEKNNKNKIFQFDSFMNPLISQEEVYQISCYNIIQDFLEGYNGTIFAYGQTGSGKTHTMIGKNNTIDGEDRGVIPRCLDDIFQHVEKMKKNKQEINIKLSYVQIYCERIFDLLQSDTPSNSLIIREEESPSSHSFHTSRIYIDGVAKINVNHVKDCFHLLDIGNKNRAVASTNMNVHSSRSHAILILIMEKKEIDPETSSINIKSSQLYLVDLAGSERVKKSMVHGIHVNELKSINLSLSALGNCIVALSENKKHIPYRDSKLTRLLQYNLGGNARTSLIVTVSGLESDFQETHSTLSFGQRAKNVPVKAYLNIIPDYKVLYESIQSNLDKKDDRINELEMTVQSCKNTENQLKETLENEILQRQNYEFELNSLKKIYLSMKNSRSDNNNHDDNDNITDNTNDNNNDNQEVDNQLSTIIAEHKLAIIELKNRYDNQMFGYKTIANYASEEWNHTMNELSHEKDAHLATLQEYKEWRERTIKNEKETAERIAELLHELSDKEKAVLKTKSEFQPLHTELTEKREKLLQVSNQLSDVEIKLKKLEQKISTDYVSREQIEKMELLYQESISRLQNRVLMLERMNTNDEQDRNEDNDTIPFKKKINSIKNKNGGAIAKIGRVVPSHHSYHNIHNNNRNL